MADAAKETGARFTRGSTFRHVTVMALTGAVGLSFVFLVDFATLFWVSRLNDEQLLAATGVAWVVQFSAIAVCIGLAIAATAIVGRAIGGGDRALAQRYASASLTITVTAMAMFTLLALASRDLVTNLLAPDSPETARIASQFLLLSLPSLPFMGIALTANALLRAEGDAVRAMVVTMTLGIVTALLDPIFIFSFDLGIDGAAIVIVIARIIASLLGVYFVIRVHRLVRWPNRDDLKRTASPFFRIALPAIFTQAATPFGTFVLTAVVASYGDAAIAGWSVVSRLAVLAFGGIYALSGAVGGVISQNYGAGLIERVASTYRDALIFSTAYVLIAWALLAAATPLLIGVFNLSPQAAEIVKAFNWIAAGAYVFAGTLFVSNAVFNNLSRPIWSAAFNWLRDGVLTWPLAVIGVALFAAPGIVYAQAVATVVAGILSGLVAWRYVARLRDLHLKTISPAPTLERQDTLPEV